MLTILKVIPETPKPFFKKLWIGIVGTKPIAQLREVGGTSYIEITVEDGRRGIPWKKVELVSLDCAGKMLLPKNIFPPANSAVTRFIPIVYPNLLMFKLFILVLKNVKDKSKTSVAVYDEGINYQSIIEIIKNAGEVKFITSRPYEKADLQKKIIDDTGASVTFTDNFESADRCKIIYAPKGLPFSILGNDNSLVFSPKGRCKGTIIKNAGVEIPEELADVYDEMYDKTEFLSAFYEIGENKFCEKVQPNTGIGFHRIYTVDKLVEMTESI